MEIMGPCIAKHIKGQEALGKQVVLIPGKNVRTVSTSAWDVETKVTAKQIAGRVVLILLLLLLVPFPVTRGSWVPRAKVTGKLDQESLQAPSS